MHIPDGFLDTKTWVTLSVVSAVAVSISSYFAKRNIRERAIPLMAVTAAFIFAAQMLNFPVAGGTSGHFLGGTLAAILLGPFAGFLVIVGVVIIQALVFQDGGILALGANIFNMGVICAFGGYFVFAAMQKLMKNKQGFLFSAFVASFLSVVVAAFLFSLEFAISGTAPLKVTLPLSLPLHVIIGIAEGIVTTAALGLIIKVKPELIPVYSKGAVNE